MKWVWTWGGKSFGYLDGEDLFTYDGRHVGRLIGDEIFGRDGKYLGEIKNENRLITSTSKKGRRSSGFVPQGRRVAHVRYVNYVGYVMYVGHEDFPSPEDL